MFGAQQIRAYKTIMKTPQHLPRHSKADARLFHVIAWGAVIIFAACLAVMVAARIAEFELEANPVFLAVIPVALALLFCWWLIDVAPILSRWLVATVAFLVSIGCLAFAWAPQLWDQVQLAALFIYAVVVAREAWRQIRAAKSNVKEAEDTQGELGPS